MAMGAHIPPHNNSRAHTRTPIHRRTSLHLKTRRGTVHAFLHSHIIGIVRPRLFPQSSAAVELSSQRRLLSAHHTTHGKTPIFLVGGASTPDPLPTPALHDAGSLLVPGLPELGEAASGHGLPTELQAMPGGRFAELWESRHEQ